ncbi:TPA: ABC transporter permease [Photobacterium damselae]|uniref:ABC transporter permease n=1 Tax=Photobacterium damselae TaxID=38293 RepID=UPI00083B01F5|nr:proline/glycine betaine ABC transporter permease [Photobacterium damselae]EHA1080078.1 proline/glycine betaine ABC transporter permease [Photobacterium damselae]NVO74433.1 proline/glycine betaine ABC transporter permease [Photobacterium damselae subsp. damselae]OEC80801.1 ABC transporter permease [Photobacterium damselae subsp. damselae]QSH58769.1 proline/glycine betaine ABC transporter permease [Photobacterium damselae subsp. damselae]SPY29533.1 Glycine betaine/L-proline transport system p
MSDSWLTEIPQLDRAQLLEIRKTLDGAYRSFSREYGDTIEGFFDPLLSFLVWFENLLLDSPWWLVIAVLATLAYVASRSWKLTLGVIVSFVLIGVFGMWDNTMRTMSIILVSTLVAIGVGIPIGIAMARSDRVQNGVTPMLDVMQTMPAFVYLIPVVMLLGIGKIPGVIAVVIYAIPPVIRLTNLGIRLVDKEVLEAATAYGASPMQRLFGVQLPLAMPNIMAGINQTIMMALAMVVIASMIGVKGLGQPVLKSITNQYFTLGLLNGLAIVALAIIFDRISQSYAKRTQQHLGGSH